MEGDMVFREELNIFINVWTSAVALLCYSYAVAASLPKGMPRVLALLPLFYFLTILPLGLTCFHFLNPSAFFLTWLCNFKLLSFCYGSGSLPHARNCLQFVLLAALPVDIKLPDDPKKTVGCLAWKQNKNQAVKTQSEDEKVSGRLCSNSRNHLRMALLAVKALVLALAVYTLYYRANLHPYLVGNLYSIICCFGIELGMAVFAIPGWIVLKWQGFELEPQFNEPLISTSMEEMWGRRWNLTVSRILRRAVYDPMRSVCIPRFGLELGSYTATFATFAVSGLMHEVIFYYYTRVAPTWEITTFFLIQGGYVVMEKVLKKRFDDSWRPNTAVSWFVITVFLTVTWARLHGIPMMRHNLEEKALRETYAVASYLKERLARTTTAYASIT